MARQRVSKQEELKSIISEVFSDLDDWEDLLNPKVLLTIETERDREGETERERERDREGETERDREGERERQRETETVTERERE